MRQIREILRQKWCLGQSDRAVAASLGIGSGTVGAYDAQHRTRVIRRLRQRAANLGFTLVDHETGEVLEGAVS